MSCGFIRHVHEMSKNHHQNGNRFEHRTLYIYSRMTIDMHCTHLYTVYAGVSWSSLPETSHFQAYGLHSRSAGAGDEVSHGIPLFAEGGLDWRCEHLCKNVQKKCLNMHWYDTYSLTHTHIYIIYTYIYWTIILWRFWGLIGIEFFRDLARRWYSHRGFGVAEAGAVASARFVRPPLRSIANLVNITPITMVYGTYNILWL